MMEDSIKKKECMAVLLCLVEIEVCKKKNKKNTKIKKIKIRIKYTKNH